MPLGAETGNLLHLLFEKIFKRGLHHPLDTYRLNALIAEEVALSPLQQWIPVLLPWMIELLTKPLLGFPLSAIPPDQVQQEMEFFFPTKNGMMKGFVDLFFTFEGKYYLLDWKSNYLGPSDASYSQENMAEALRCHQYDLQASIYAEALERYVKLFDTRPFAECFGGAIYYFVRGKAVYHFIPKHLRELYE
jgi:exodeoxyribonuclease V beta subunit